MSGVSELRDEGRDGQTGCYDFDKLRRHSYHYTQAPEGLKKSMSPDCMMVVIHA